MLPGWADGGVVIVIGRREVEPQATQRVHLCIALGPDIVVVELSRTSSYSVETLLCNSGTGQDY